MIYLAYFALAVTVVAAFSGSRQSLFICLYALSWELMGTLTSGSVVEAFKMPDFPYYIAFGVFIDYFFIGAYVATHFKNINTIILLFLSSLSGSLYLIETAFFDHRFFMNAYDYIQLGIALMLAFEAAKGARDSGFVFGNAVRDVDHDIST